MVQSNTAGFSLDKIFAKLAETFPNSDQTFFKELMEVVTNKWVSDDRELTRVLLKLLSSDELRAEMKPLILEIIRNEGLNKYV